MFFLQPFPIDEAEQALSGSQALCERNGDRRGPARTLDCLSRVYFERGQPGAAERLARECDKLCEKLGNHAGPAAALGHLGMILMHHSRLAGIRFTVVRAPAVNQRLVFT